MPKLAGVNIVSMSLYGSSPRYTAGAVKNAELVKVNFPGWKLRIYCKNALASGPAGASVPQDILNTLNKMNVDLHFIQPEDEGVPPMMWRFLVADDPSVDRFIIRDTDSRLTQRDASAVYDWVKSDAAFHCVRDHPSHANYAVSGGMWGGKAKQLRTFVQKSWRDMMLGSGKQYLADMNFLNSKIWPKVKSHAYCSDSVSCKKYESSHPFSFPRPAGWEHVGQVYTDQELGRPIDINILKRAGEKAECLPPGYDRAGHKVNQTVNSPA